MVALAPRAPDSPEIEEQLLLGWINETVRAIVELAVPDEQGQPRAPIHLIFWNRFEQRLLLDGLARHFKTIAGATPVYDFLTQLAAFNSPVATFLDREIAELKNYPMVCQSLQTVAAFLGFDWNKDVPYRDLFRTRMFDFWGKLDALEGTGQSAWYTSRSRFNSQIPLEYAYAAWGDLPTSSGGSRDELAAYRAATPELLRGFHLRRLEAIEHMAHDFRGNRQTVKSAFDLPDLAAFSDKARTLAHALDEFVTIERHVELEQWKSTRLLPPERACVAWRDAAGPICGIGSGAGCGLCKPRKRAATAAQRAVSRRVYARSSECEAGAATARTTHGERMGSGRASRPAAFGNNRTRLRARRVARTFDSAARRHGCAFRALDGRRAAAT